MYKYNSEKHKCEVLKCAVCGYAYGESWYLDKIKFPYGRKPFLRISQLPSVTYKTDTADGYQISANITTNFYICPNCGTAGIAIEKKENEVVKCN